MRLELSSLLEKVELSKTDTNQHVRVHFFDAKLLERSEFIYKNHLIQIKDTDLVMMDEALKLEEEETAKRIAAEKQPVAVAPTGKDAKKADPKAAAKGKPAAKGAVVQEDPNSPKDITIDYPTENMAALADYVVIDRTYHQMRENANPSAQKAKVDPTLDKKTVRLQQLQEAYEIIRGIPISCATVVRLNYVEPPVPVEERAASPEEPVVKGKAPLKKK